MAADSAYNSKKAYISKTHLKVKNTMLMYEPATIHGLKGEFLWKERQHRELNLHARAGRSAPSVLSTARARCLIVLDGLRTKAWKAFREILPLTWSRIMITTRSRDSAKVENSKEQLVHEMRTLRDQEGWELFNAKLHVIQLEQLGEKIVRKCASFPSEILTVGDLLSRRDATEDQWLKVLNEYVNPGQKLVINIKAAADALPPNLKDCLSSLELFHEDYRIPRRRLILYWVSKGLMKQESGSNEAPEDIAEKYLTEFIQDNLIQAVKWKLNGKLKTCRVNYFLKDG